MTNGGALFARTERAITLSVTNGGALFARTERAITLSVTTTGGALFASTERAITLSVTLRDARAVSYSTCNCRQPRLLWDSVLAQGGLLE